jgi:hypothetical protein
MVNSVHGKIFGGVFKLVSSSIAFLLKVSKDI